MLCDVDRTERAHETMTIAFLAPISFILFCEGTMSIALFLPMRLQKGQFGGKRAFFL
jgi:hypothetical protein